MNGNSGHEYKILPRFYYSREFEKRRKTILDAGAVRMSYKKDKIFYNASKAPHDMYYIEEGVAKLIFIDESGNENLLYFLGPGSIWPINLLNEEFTLESYLYMISVTDIKVLALTQDQLKTMLRGDVDFMFDIINHYSRQGNMYISRFFIAANQDVSCQLASFLLSFLEFQPNNHNEIFLGQTDLMSLMGISRSTLARSVRKLKYDGIIETYKNRIRIIDKEKLYEMSSELMHVI